MHNRNKIKQGNYASLLTLKGIDQAKSVAYRLQKLDLNLSEYTMVVSPLVRTRHTAQIIREILGYDGINLVEEDLILERNAGIFTNVPKSVIKEKIQNLDTESKKWDFKFENGESREDLYIRLQKFCEKYKDQKNLIIITHGRTGQILKECLLKTSLEEIKEISSGNTGFDQNYFFCIDENNSLTKL